MKVRDSQPISPRSDILLSIILRTALSRMQLLKYWLEGMCQCQLRLGSFVLDQSRTTNISNGSFAHCLTRPPIRALPLNAVPQITNRLTFTGVVHDASQQRFLFARLMHRLDSEVRPPLSSSFVLTRLRNLNTKGNGPSTFAGATKPP